MIKLKTILSEIKLSGDNNKIPAEIKTIEEEGISIYTIYDNFLNKKVFLKGYLYHKIDVDIIKDNVIFSFINDINSNIGPSSFFKDYLFNKKIPYKQFTHLSHVYIHVNPKHFESI